MKVPTLLVPPRCTLLKFPVKIVSAVGSGDALVAGFLAGLEENWSVATCLKFANAVAISNACNVGAGVIDLEQVRKLESL